MRKYIFLDRKVSFIAFGKKHVPLIESNHIAMAKFGTLIQSAKPVLIEFFLDNELTQNNYEVLKTVAAALGDKATVIRIDTEQNNELAKALRIKTNPTYIIYKEEQMLWRQPENHDANSLINAVLKYV